MVPATDTRQRLIDSARELIYSRSYADVGVAAICEHAGVRKGSFYHFFPSKQELTLAVLDASFLEMKQELLDRAFAPDRPPLARLERFLDMAWAFQKQMKEATGHMPGCPFGNLGAELSTRDEAIRRKVDAVFASLRTGIRDLLTEAVQAGDMEAVDIDATAAAMLAYFEGVLLTAKTQNDPDVLKQLAPAMLSIRIPPRAEGA